MKIVTSIPSELAIEFMDILSKVMQPVDPRYSGAFCYYPVKGTWIANDGANPARGEIGKRETVDETRIEFIIPECNLEIVIKTIKEFHPYEVPVIDVIPLYDKI